MSIRTDDLYLVDIIESAERIAVMTGGYSSERFQSDQILSSAVQYQLIVIGEACTKLSERTIESIEGASLPQIRSFRNRIVHGYFAVDVAIVWEVATIHVPRLGLAAEQALRELFPETYARLLERREAYGE